MKRYYPKSQILQLGAVLIWALSILAIRQSIGLDWRSGGPALVFLSGLGVGIYLLSGKRLDVDPGGGRVRSVWRMVGVPLWRREREFAAQRVELRPEWMTVGGGLQTTLVYDLVLAGRETKAGAEACERAFDLKEDQLAFALAERKARAAGEDMDLPVAVRWDRRFEDAPCEVRERGEWDRSFAYPVSLQHWKRL